MREISKMIQKDIEMLQNRIDELKKQNEIMGEALEVIKQQDQVRGFPTASEWYYAVFNATEALEKIK